MIKSFCVGIILLMLTITYWITTEPSHWNWYIVGIGLMLLTAVFVINAEWKEEEILKRIEKIEKTHKENE